MVEHMKGVPADSSVVMPRLYCRDVAAEIDFCQNTFGAVELNRRPGPDGTAAHALMKIGPAMIMIEAEWPSLPSRAPKLDGSSSVVIYVYVEDVDKTVERALAGGAKVLFPFRINSGATASVGLWIRKATYGPSPRASKPLPKKRERGAGPPCFEDRAPVLPRTLLSFTQHQRVKRSTTLLPVVHALAKRFLPSHIAVHCSEVKFTEKRRKFVATHVTAPVQ